MKKILQRGFTLIELLVVIAIIGILAAVVLASLNDARDGGQDAAIKQSIGNIRSQAELIYNANGFSYINVCQNVATNPVVRLLTAAATNRAETSNTPSMINGGTLTLAAANTVSCRSDIRGYVAIAPLNDGSHWCIDSTGFVGSTTLASVVASDVGCAAGAQ